MSSYFIQFCLVRYKRKTIANRFKGHTQPTKKCQNNSYQWSSKYKGIELRVYFYCSAHRVEDVKCTHLQPHCSDFEIRWKKWMLPYLITEKLSTSTLYLELQYEG